VIEAASQPLPSKDPFLFNLPLAEGALEATRTQGLSLDVLYKKPYSARHQFKKLYLHLNDSTKPVGID
jgi:hypothetical protein